MRMYSRDGMEMMDIYSVDKEGSVLVVKGKMMRTMPATIYVKPIEVWNARKLLKWSVIFYLPVMFLKGLFSSLKKK